MEGISQDCSFVRCVADALTEERFTLVDIGCSGGIDDLWRLYGDRLRAVAFDPNIDECARLEAQETNPGIKYVAAFVGLRSDHPFARQKTGKPHLGNNPWARLGIARTLQIRQEEIENMSSEEKTKINAWTATRLADSNQPVYLPDFLSERQIDDIDFIKLDVDGPDFEILHSLEDVFADARVIGAGMEVNFVGSGAETDHTFHNTDRFMRKQGFDLFNLTVRRYSVAALPSRYLLAQPAQSELGRPLQGDALYIRDLCNPGQADFVANLSPEKLLKAAAIFAAFNLPDCAAEILLKFRAKLASRCDVEKLLDILAAQVQRGAESVLSYKEYIAAFEKDQDLFYLPPRRPPLTAASALHRAVAASRKLLKPIFRK
jgi:FkbM family methyltransferase